jgi:hypothetical protein
LVLHFLVVDHALAQRADGGRGYVHGSAPVVNRGGLPQHTTYADPRLPLTINAYSTLPYRASGLVQRPTAVIGFQKLTVRFPSGSGQSISSKTTGATNHNRMVATISIPGCRICLSAVAIFSHE